MRQCYPFISFPSLICFSRPEGVWELEVPLCDSPSWGGSFVFLDVGPSILLLVFSLLLGALFNIYGREGFINVILCLQLELAPTSTHQNRWMVCVEREIATNTFHCIPVPKLTTVVRCIYQPFTCIVLIIAKWYSWFFWGHLCEKCFEKK